MDEMTPEERVSYSHDRIKRSMADFQGQIDKMHRDILRERNLWFFLVAISTVLIIVVFYIAGPNSIEDYIIIVTIFVAFTVIRFVSYSAMRRQIAMMEGMQFLYSRLANDTTIQFVSESMKVEKDAEEIKKMSERHIGDDKILKSKLVLAGNIVEAIVTEVDKHKAATGAQEENVKSDDAA